jgi:ligand-binding SRPBCC domain-containing protein
MPFSLRPTDNFRLRSGSTNLEFLLEMRELFEQVEIAAPPERVWEALADFGDVAAWAPYMRISHLVGDQERGIGTRRAMQHELGFRFEERVTAWDEGEGFAFDVLRAPWPMNDVRESWRITVRDGGTLVSTRVLYGMKVGPAGALLDWSLVRFIVRREMRSGLRGLKEYLERPAAKTSPA